MGFLLRAFARGEDASDVKPLDRISCDVDREVKSYGNGITFPRDITDPMTAKAVIWMLAESVAQRMREGRARARTISIGAKSANDLTSYTRQAKAPLPTNITGEVAHIAWMLLCAHEPLDEAHPLRGLYVRASNLVPADDNLQLMLFDSLPRRTEREKLDTAIDELRRRFGNNCVVWGPQAIDPTAWELDAKRDNVVHPVSFFHR